jgi:hypothetical protein
MYAEVASSPSSSPFGDSSLESESYVSRQANAANLTLFGPLDGGAGR